MFAERSKVVHNRRREGGHHNRQRLFKGLFQVPVSQSVGVKGSVPFTDGPDNPSNRNGWFFSSQWIPQSFLPKKLRV
jgi:hypothetical protein